MNLSLMTYNVRLGLETSLAEVADAVAAAGVPDLLALQEIGVSWQMGERVHQPAYLADRLGMPYRAFAGALTDAEGGRFGVALLSKFPLKSVDFTLLPQAADERRVLLHAVVATRPAVHVFNTHLSVYEAERLPQARLVAAAVGACAGPVVLMGDFNDRPGTPALAELGRGLTDLFDTCGTGDPLTFSVRNPNRRIDYLLCGGGLSPAGPCRVVTEARASDHFPLAGGVAWAGPVV